MITEKQNRGFRKGFFMLMCGTIGAGFFALPNAILNTGVIPATIIIIFLGMVVILFHLIIAEISLSLPGEKTLLGMVNYVLPKSFSQIFSFLITGYLLLCLIAYVTLGGGFISLLGGFLDIPLNPTRSTFIFVCIIGFFQRKEDKILNNANITLGLILLFCIGLILLGGLTGEYSISTIGNNRSNRHMTYGIAFLALNGMISIPLLYNATGKSAIKMRSVILNAGFSVTLLSLFFCFAVLSISGISTSFDSILGLSRISPFLGYIGSVLGLVAIASSHLAAGIHLQKMTIKDFGFQKLPARGRVVLTPFIAYLYFNPNIMDILGIAGGIIGSLLIILIVYVNIHLHRRGQKIKIVAMIDHDQFRSKILIIICLVGVLAQLLSIVY